MPLHSMLKELWLTIKVTGTRHSVRAGIRKAQPVTITQHWQLNILVDTISAIAGRAPECARVNRSTANDGWQLW